jgi:hypothetical protein
MKSALIASLTVLALTAPTFAATTDKYQYKDESAYASFYQYDGCNYTYVSVSAYENIAKTAPGSSTSQKQAFLSYSSYNYCNGTISYGYGSLSNPNLNISKKLDSATLTGTFTVNDYYGNSQNVVEVSLEWTGEGDISRGRNQSSYQGPGYFSKYRGTGSYRDANVTGNVTVNGTNLISNLSGDAGLSSSTSGSMTIIK